MWVTFVALLAVANCFYVPTSTNRVLSTLADPKLAGDVSEAVAKFRKQLLLQMVIGALLFVGLGFYAGLQMSQGGSEDDRFMLTATAGLWGIVAILAWNARRRVAAAASARLQPMRA